MTRLLHISSSPRGAASESLRIAEAFLDAYRLAQPQATIETWDLWDGTLPAFGPEEAQEFGLVSHVAPAGQLQAVTAKIVGALRAKPSEALRLTQRLLRRSQSDEVLERIYVGRRFRNDTERLEKLFELYTKMTSKKPAA